VFTARYGLSYFIKQVTLRLKSVKVLINSQLKPGLDIHMPSCGISDAQIRLMYSRLPSLPPITVDAVTNIGRD
jgi:hypothetical protein